MKLQSTHLTRTAYHEAGHAVLAHVVGLRVLGVSLERDEDSFGRTFYHYVAPGLTSHRLVDCRARRRLEAYVLCYLAGVEAEARFAGRRDRTGAAADMERALGFAWRVVLSADELDAYMRWLETRTKCLVARYWAVIDGLARRLVLTQTMGEREVRQAIQGLAQSRRTRVALATRASGEVSHATRRRRATGKRKQGVRK